MNLNHIFVQVLAACVAAIALAAPASPAAAASPILLEAASYDYRVPILAYHDIVAARSDKDEPDTVSVDSLVRHLSWIHAKGFTPVTVAQLQAARLGQAPLPLKPIVLTFDDGYASFHTYVLPLLKAYRWPAVLALIGIRHSADSTGHEGAVYLNRRQLRDIADSGLVDFANHSFNLHHGLVSNAWGNSQPAAVTRGWTKAGVESDAQWRARVSLDLQRNQAAIRELTGKTPTVMVWPYGRYNHELKSIALESGLSLMMTLVDGVSDVRSEPTELKRHLLGRDDIEGAIAGVVNEQWKTTGIVRAVVIRAEDLLPTARLADESLLSARVAKLADLQGNVVALDPFERRGGKVTSAIFNTTALPVAFDYANRISAVVIGKAGYGIWLSVPLSKKSYPAETDVLALVEDAAKAVPVSGLIVEDASQVSDDLVVAAIERIARWRPAPRLALSFDNTTPPLSAEAKVTSTRANYVWATGMAASGPELKVPTIHAIGADAHGRAKGQILRGLPHLALTELPAEVGAWVDIFSLRAVPRVRIGPKAK